MQKPTAERILTLAFIVIASVLCLHAPPLAAPLDVGDCQTNLFQQGYLNGVNDDCPPDFSNTREDFTLALQGAGYPCNQVLGSNAGFHFDQGEKRFYQDRKQLGLAHLIHGSAGN